MSRKYNLINNIGGWLVFAVALITYWLTLEPTASYWDCGEFIIQADKLEVGHPPGNPIFMLTARFFANFASSPEKIALMVNAMSGLLSALTILLLFWSTTHLIRRLIAKDSEKEISLTKYIAIMGGGLVASLAYAWSDTFWFSAVEGEVYAFSSFCTALVFWLILKWEDQADEPHSDRWLILIAYIIGVSVAVHLLNLLCIPAIVLVFAYRKYPDMGLLKSLAALLISFAIIFLVLYGLVPGLIKMAGEFELIFVNGFHLGFNSGAIFYALLLVAALVWSLYTLAKGTSPLWMKISFIVATGLSGTLCFGNSPLVWILILAIFAAAIFYFFRKRFPVRVMSVIMWSMTVVFIGYSSYALILIRSSADTPMNQNSPDNVFDLASYLNREQYGENPIFYGQTFNSGIQKRLLGYSEQGIPVYRGIINDGKPLYTKGVAGAVPRSENGSLTVGDSLANAALAQHGGDYYVKKDYKQEPVMNPELDMFFPRLYSRLHKAAYAEWVPSLDDPSVQAENMVTLSAIDADTGEKTDEQNLQGEPTVSAMGTYVFPAKTAFKPTLRQNLEYFGNYQLNHMFTRYFMWNFAGRQNDLLNQHGEMDAGNWISGIPFIDNPRLGDQSQLPYELGEGNRGHNVYYMLPLILGIIGLLWQAFSGKRGIEQFWVVFFLFFMTGIAIVLYLNQTPGQPRERDYSFAGAFYAFAIWIGMGVPALWRIFRYLINPDRKNADQKRDEETGELPDDAPAFSRKSLGCAALAAVLGIAVPLQMVSQTWDDHDRSGRYAARDYAINYLQSLEPNAIVFCNGDNDTFPLWYAQEVEGVRPDVRIINLSYLSSDWYAGQLQLKAYDADPVKTLAKPADFAYGLRDAVLIDEQNSQPMDLREALKLVYKDYGLPQFGYPAMPTKNVYIPVDKRKVIERGLVAPADSAKIVDRIEVDLSQTSAYRSKGYLSLGDILMLDIVATDAAEGWQRPVYWACTIGDEYHVGLTPYMRTVGMVHQIVPTVQESKNARTDRSYEVIADRYLFGIRTTDAAKMPYYDETASRMLASTRGTMLITAEELLAEGDRLAGKGDKKGARQSYEKAQKIVDLLESRQPQSLRPYELQTAPSLAQLLCRLSYANRLADRRLQMRGLSLLKQIIVRYAQYVKYEQMIRLNFGNVSLTYETFAVPYRLWSFIEMYQKYGGNMKALEKLPALQGIDLKGLKEKSAEYDRQMSAQDSGSGEASETEQLDMVASIVNILAAMPQQEYMSQDLENRLYDSLYYHLYQEMLKSGHTAAELNALPEVKKVDMGRAKRLGDEFQARHPDYFE